jgi:predicted Mrr-cat superfamily restriction endonuclease
VKPTSPLRRLAPLLDQNDLLGAVFANCQTLDEDMRAELPLKRVWTLAVEPDA